MNVESELKKNQHPRWQSETKSALGKKTYLSCLDYGPPLYLLLVLIYIVFWIFTYTLKSELNCYICTLRHSLLRSSTINPLQVLGICMLKAEVLMKELLLTREMINKRMLNTGYCKYLSIMIWVEKNQASVSLQSFLNISEHHGINYRSWLTVAHAHALIVTQLSN